ncbi:phage tail tube protein [Nitrosomonas sp.]|uniref:phage tail tube protein n=1 Tax=Nitrosomonas sp. TaxID=42353 RepID=UPI0025E0B1DD|nr:phage tail tube protein [Nitrosomonas sp.]
MGKLMRNVVLAVKEETTYGTDIVPTSAANSILARVSDVQPVVAEFVDRDNIKPYLGSSGKVEVSAHSELTVEIELAGASAAGTVPGWAPLLKACGFGETIVASTSVTYKPVSTAFKSVSIYYFLDGLLHKMIGCMGTPTFTLNARGIPMISIKLTGLYSATTDTALPTDSDYSAFLAPQAVNKVNTTAFTLHGVSSAFDQLSIDGGNTVIYRNMPTLEDVLITDRKVSGSISIQMSSVAIKAWHDTVRDGTIAALSMSHGSGAGKTFTISAPKAQLVNPQYQDKDGVVMLNLGLDLQPDAGNDELSIAIT